MWHQFNWCICLLFFVKMSSQTSKPCTQMRERLCLWIRWEKEKATMDCCLFIVLWITFSWLLLLDAFQVSSSSHPPSASLFKHFPWKLANFQFQSFFLSLKWQPSYFQQQINILSTYFQPFQNVDSSFKLPIFSLERFFIFSNKLIFFLRTFAGKSVKQKPQYFA